MALDAIGRVPPQKRFEDMIISFEKHGDEFVYYYDKTYVDGKTIKYEVVEGISLVYHNLNFKVHDIYPAEDENAIRMNYCISGRCEFCLSKKQVINLGAGDFLAGSICSKDDRHSFPFGNYTGISLVANETDLNKFLKMIFPDSQLRARRLIDKIKSNGSFVYAANDPVIHDIMEGLFLGSDTYKKERTIIKLAELILYLIDNDLMVGGDNGKYFDHHIVKKVKQIKREVTEHLDNYVKIDEISDKYGISVRAFSECFKAVYGKTYYAFIKEFRMKKSAEMLRTTNENIGHIAIAVGYQNASKFSKAFFDIMGVVPQTYRNNHLMTELE